MMSGLCTYMNTARASLSVLWPQCSCCKWGHPRSLEVTRGHQSPAWAEVARGPEAVNTHSASSLGAHSAISGLSLGPACSLPLSALSLSLSSPGPRSGGCCPQCPGWAQGSCWSDVPARTEAGQPGEREECTLVTRTQTQSRVRLRSWGLITLHYRDTVTHHTTIISSSLLIVIVTPQSRILYLNFIVAILPSERLGHKSMILDKANLTQSFCKHF